MPTSSLHPIAAPSLSPRKSPTSLLGKDYYPTHELKAHLIDLLLKIPLLEQTPEILRLPQRLVSQFLFEYPYPSSRPLADILSSIQYGHLTADRAYQLHCHAPITEPRGLPYSPSFPAWNRLDQPIKLFLYTASAYHRPAPRLTDYIVIHFRRSPASSSLPTRLDTGQIGQWLDKKLRPVYASAGIPFSYIYGIERSGFCVPGTKGLPRIPTLHANLALHVPNLLRPRIRDALARYAAKFLAPLGASFHTRQLTLKNSGTPVYWCRIDGSRKFGQKYRFDLLGLGDYMAKETARLLAAKPRHFRRHGKLHLVHASRDIIDAAHTTYDHRVQWLRAHAV